MASIQQHREAPLLNSAAKGLLEKSGPSLEELREMARRSFQKGEKLKKVRGGWSFRFWEKVIEDGQLVAKQRRRFISEKEAPLKREAEKVKENFLATINHPDYRPLRASTFKEFAEMWLRDVVSMYKPASRQCETSTINHHLIPFFGNLMMKDIDLFEVQRFVAQADVSPRTLRNHVNVLHRMCKKAKKYGYTDRAWEIGDVDFPRDSDPRQAPHFTREQMEQIINLGGEFKLLFQLLAVTGMRIMEACALKVDDIEPDAKPVPIVRVRRSLYKRQEMTPKTSNSVRTFRIPTWLCRELMKAGTGYIFKDSDGRAYTYHYPFKKLVAIRKALGIKGSFHAFRHGQATLMDEKNIPSATKMARLGHGTIGMTQRYTHANDQNDIEWAIEVGEMFRPVQ